MIKIIYRKNQIEGELSGFSPGSNEFEIALVGDLKILLTAKSQKEADLFTRMRISMNNVGLVKLKNSVIDFNRGRINLVDGPTTPVVEDKNSISSTFIA